MMIRKFGNHWLKYRDLVELMNSPSNMEICLCWYQKRNQQKVDIRS